MVYLGGRFVTGVIGMRWLLAVTLLLSSLIAAEQSLRPIELPVRSEVLYGGIEVVNKEKRYPSYEFKDLPAAWQKALCSKSMQRRSDAAISNASFFILPAQGAVQGVVIWTAWDGLVGFDLAVLRDGKLVAERKLLGYDPEEDDFVLREFKLTKDQQIEVYTQTMKRNKQDEHVPVGKRQLEVIYQLRQDGILRIK